MKKGIFVRNVLTTFFILVLGALLARCELLSQTVEPTHASAARYNVAWDSPSKDFNGSMPLGNGDIGINAWVEANGDLLFYIGKTDSWDDYGRLLKVGRVRVHLEPRPAGPLVNFRQTLDLDGGTMTVRFKSGGDDIGIRLWVDAHHPVICIAMESERKVGATATIELWRTKKDTLPTVETSDVFNEAGGKQRGLTVVEPDELLQDGSASIGWYHHNRKSVGPELSARLQGMQDFPRPDPLLHRTFGAVITAPRGVRLDPRRLSSAASRHHEFSVYVVTRHPATPAQWRQAVGEEIAATEEMSIRDRRLAHEQWWKAFWGRSWIHVRRSSAAPTVDVDDAFLVSRAYALQRFIAACSGRGRFPIKFNGSIFTVPSPGQPGDAEYRRWGPGYWWQNTRLPYVSMCTSGDTDLMMPLFTMYARDLMPLFRYRTERYFGHNGTFIPECIMFWGDVFNVSYGWMPYEERTDKLQESGYHKWEWVSGPELAFMMLDYFDHTQDSFFLREMLLPAAGDILTFFAEHYRTDAAGKLLMHPSQALETWWECTNPMPEIAGLHAVVRRLLALPAGLTTPGQREFWLSLQRKLPDLPVRTVKGVAMLAPADTFANKQNIENPELYAVFPFRLIALEKPDRALAVAALKHREDRGNFGWRQDDVFMAYLGLADSARHYLVGRATSSDTNSRFPAFWGPNYDWVPDQDHGSVILKTLQAMLLQTEGEQCMVFPAWPREWDVEFRLHAPRNVIIEGEVRNGRVVRVTTQPEGRRPALHIMEPQ